MNINGRTYNQKKFDKFLRSEKSDYISHSINKIQKSYIFNSTNKINIIDKIKKLFLYFFDTFQLDKSIKKKNIDILIISNLLSSKSISSDLYFGQLDKILLKQQIKTKRPVFSCQGHSQ